MPCSLETNIPYFIAQGHGKQKNGDCRQKKKSHTQSIFANTVNSITKILFSYGLGFSLHRVVANSLMPALWCH